MSRGLGQVERDILGVLESWGEPTAAPQSWLIKQLPSYKGASVRRAINGLASKGRLHKAVDRKLGPVLSVEPIAEVQAPPNHINPTRPVLPRDPRTDIGDLILQTLEQEIPKQRQQRQDRMQRMIDALAKFNRTPEQIESVVQPFREAMELNGVDKDDLIHAVCSQFEDAYDFDDVVWQGIWNKRLAEFGRCTKRSRYKLNPWCYQRYRRSFKRLLASGKVVYATAADGSILVQLPTTTPTQPQC